MAARAGPLTTALGCACMAWSVAGCAEGRDRPREPAPDSPPARVAPQPATSTTPAAAGQADCSAAERRAARNVWLWQAVTEVTSAPTGNSVRARDTAAKRTARVEGRLLEKCGGRLPPAFERFSSDIDATVSAAWFGDAQLDEVLAAWLRWGSAVGAPETARREVRELEACRDEFFPLFDASYEIGSNQTETGVAWWVDLAFDNRTGMVLDGSMSGTAEVTEMLEDPFGWDDGPQPGPGTDAVLRWGGSSAEALELQPGRTTLTAAPDIDQDVHTTTDGTFRVIEVTVGLGARGENYSCTPPMRPLP